MMKLKALFAAAVFGALVPLILMVALATQAQPKRDLSPSFNVAAMQAQMALSCTDQQALRRSNMLPPYFPGTPPAFENGAAAFVINSPHLRPGQLKTAKDLFPSVPEHVRGFGYRGGATYVFVRRGIVEAGPALREETAYFSDSGLYMAVDRRLFVPFEKGDALVKGADGKYTAKRWTVSHREPFRIVNHESGHMVADLVGDFSKDALGDDNDHRLSNRPDFVKAYEADLRRLTSRANKVPRSEIVRMGYYLPVAFEGKPLGGQRDTPNRARREVFAELWAEVQGYDSNRLSTAFPDAYITIKEINDFLKDLHDRRAVRCTYGADGSASPAVN